MAADRVVHATFHDLPRHLRPGDLVVVNTSATRRRGRRRPARDGREVRVHFSTELPGGLWLVEARQPVDGTTVALDDDLTA